MMRTLITWFAVIFWKCTSSLRYRIEYKGLDDVEKLLKNSPKGALFLPNHPAIVVDPLAVLYPIFTRYSVCPLITEYMYYNPLFFPFLKKLGALPIPGFSSGFNTIKLARLKKTLAAMSTGLAEGKRYVLYPSGGTKTTGREVIGGAFGAHQLLEEHPDIHVILVRTTGLWGSRFSRAQFGGKTVPLAKVLKDSIKDILRAAIFFLPRRKICIEYVVAPPDFPRSAQKNVLNRYLERWYNSPYESFPNKAEPYTDVPYSRWKENPPHEDLYQEPSIEEKTIPPHISEDIISKIAEIAKISPDSIIPSQNLIADLNLDSLNIAELITYVEVKYGIQQISPEALSNVASVILAIAGQLPLEEQEEPLWSKTGWEKPRSPKRMFLGEGKNILSVFLQNSYRHCFETIVVDPFLGPTTYYQIRTKIFLASKAIEKLPGDTIGILLPASIGAQVLILACQMAGKIPVMINWTVGGKHLEAVNSLANIKSILISWAFMDRLENVDLTPIQDKLIIMEELKATFSLLSLMTAPIKALLSTRILRMLGLAGAIKKITPDTEAVILFTSGTEALPKGVPLTHRNILSNMRATLQSIDIYSTDRFISALPPFHSFGFTVTGLLPILSGIRAYFSPNPIDAQAQARAIKEWDISILCSAPSFLFHILRQGKKEPFTNLRVVVAGAEKATEDLHNLVNIAAPNSTLWVGYGVTECSPVLSINTKGDLRYGVGKPIPTVRFDVVDMDDYNKSLPPNTTGMILATGPNMFNGYLQSPSVSPFFEKDGVRWYITGDLGSISDDGYLSITGRLKRFVKIGGEMISLGAIESSINSIGLLTKGADEGPQIALCAKGESDGRPRLILFSTQEIPLAALNAALRQSGFSNLVRIDQVCVIPAIPLSGTGKISYRDLENRT